MPYSNYSDGNLENQSATAPNILTVLIQSKLKTHDDMRSTCSLPPSDIHGISISSFIKRAARCLFVEVTTCSIHWWQNSDSNKVFFSFPGYPASVGISPGSKYLTNLCLWFDMVLKQREHKSKSKHVLHLNRGPTTGLQWQPSHLKCRNTIETSTQN